MRRDRSGKNAAAFMLVVVVLGLVAMAAGMESERAQNWVLIAWIMGSLTLLGWFDGALFRIDGWWLAVLVGSGMLWQVQVVGPSLVDGLTRAWVGAGVGFAIGALPIAAAEAVGGRWPFYPGDVLLFVGLGVLVGPRGLLWVLLLGVLCSLGRHVCVQRRRGRSWRRGYVALAPGMAVAAGAVFVALNLDFIAGAAG